LAGYDDYWQGNGNLWGASNMKFFIPILFALIANASLAADIAPRDGWVVMKSPKSFGELVDDIKSAVKANKMGVVTQAGPTGAAKKRGIEIPGNRVIGVFNNQFAVRILGLSTAAMIEAPIRIYVTENEDKTASLSYKTPSHIFAPYMAEAAGLDLEASALDEIFHSIADAAVR
jgi:uncharacterized protein (DUF302 family)